VWSVCSVGNFSVRCGLGIDAFDEFELTVLH
jgi:hypothetical protein